MQQQLLEPLRGQVLPGGVDLLNQLDLAGAVPVLELLLAGDGAAHILEALKVQQPVDVVLRSVRPRTVLTMLRHAPAQVIGHANVQIP